MEKEDEDILNQISDAVSTIELEHNCKPGNEPKEYELILRCNNCGFILLALDLNKKSLSDAEKELIKSLIKFSEEVYV